MNNSQSYPNITLTNSTLRFQVIYVQASLYLNLDANSVLDANGTGFMQGLGFNQESNGINGASFAGQGGHCSNVFYNKTYGNAHQMMDRGLGSTQTDFQQFIGSGGGVSNKSSNLSRGGGAIVIKSQVFNIQGLMSASGFPQNMSTVPSDQPVSGGSGGYVFIQQQIQNSSNNDTSIFSQKIHVSGGFGQNEGEGGSGGRIVIDHNQSEATLAGLVDAIGGSNPKYQQSLQYCLNGAPGTVYFATTQRIIVKGNCNILTPMKTPITALKDQTPPLNLVASNCVNIAPTNYTDTDGSNRTELYFQNLTIQQQAKLTSPLIQIENTTNVLNCSTLLMNTQGLIELTNGLRYNLNCNQINMIGSKMNLQPTLQSQIKAYNLTMDSSSYMCGGSMLSIVANVSTLSSIQPDCSQSSPRAFTGSTTLSVVANQSITLLGSGYINIDNISLLSGGDININGTMVPHNASASTCITDKNTKYPFLSLVNPALNPGTQQQLLSDTDLIRNVMDFNSLTDNITFVDVPKYVLMNYTTSIVALGNLNIQSQATVNGSRIGVYGNQLNLMGTLNAAAQGCYSDQGLGAGKPGNLSSCGGGGAAHAGNGGIAQNQQPQVDCSRLGQNLNESFAQAYGNYNDFYMYEGSGGGSMENSGTGGRGGGIIWIEALNVSMNGFVITDGGNATQQTDSGGGSGGSIFIGAYYLDGSGTISSQGGSAQPNFKGGAGSAGRIKLLRFNWQDLTYFEHQDINSKLNLYYKGGQSIQMDGRAGSMWSSPCPLGFAGLNCQKCPEGFYSNDINARECTPCTNMLASNKTGYYYLPDKNTPWTNPNCPYYCISGITKVSENPYCLENFDLFLQNIGGGYLLALMIVAMFLVIFFMVFYLLQKNKYKTIDKLIEQGDKALKEPSDQPLQIVDTQDISDQHGSMLFGTTIRQQLYSKNFQFFDRDIYQHFSRIYFIGSNTYDQPWKLPINPPAAMMPRIILQRYNDFVNDVNKQLQWKRWEGVAISLVKYLYPALLPKFINWRRRNHCFKLIQILSNNTERMQIWKNEEDRMKDYIQVKFSFSNKVNTGYIDFLDQRLTSDAFEGPLFPCTLFLSGEGKFSNPFYLDYDQDPIIKSIGMKCGNHKLWKKFVRNLNSKLWNLQIEAFNWEIKNQLFDILNYIEIVNSRIFFQLNFKISLWIVELTTEYQSSNYFDWRGSESNEFLVKTELKEAQYKLSYHYLKKKPNSLNNFLTHMRRSILYNRNKEFRIAIVLQSTQINGQNVDENEMLIKETQTIRSLSSDQNKFQGYSIMKSVAAHLNPKYQVAQKPFQVISASSLEQSNNLDLSHVSDKYNEMPLKHTTEIPNTPIIGGSLENDERVTEQLAKKNDDDDDKIQWLTNNMREDGNQKEWLRQFKQLDEPETFNDKMKQFFKDMGVTIVSLTYFVGFRNRLPGSHSMIFLIAFLVFVVLDVIFSLQLIITKQKDSGTADIISQYVFIFVYPLTSVISPIIGIIAMLSCKSNLYMTYALFNHVSLFTNTLLLIILQIISADFFSNIQFEFLIAMLLFVTKLLLAQLLPLQVSYFNNSKYDKNMEYLEEHFNRGPGTQTKQNAGVSPANQSSFIGGQLVRNKKAQTLIDEQTEYDASNMNSAYEKITGVPDVEDYDSDISHDNKFFKNSKKRLSKQIPVIDNKYKISTTSSHYNADEQENQYDSDSNWPNTRAPKNKSNLSEKSSISAGQKNKKSGSFFNFRKNQKAKVEEDSPVKSNSGLVKEFLQDNDESFNQNYGF